MTGGNQRCVACMKLWQPTDVWGRSNGGTPPICGPDRPWPRSICGLHRHVVLVMHAEEVKLRRTVGARLPANWPANLTHLYRPHRRVRGQARSYNDGWQPAMCGIHKAVAFTDVWDTSNCGNPTNARPHQTAGRRSTCGLHRTVGAGLLAKALGQSTGPVLIHRVRQQAGSYSLSRSSPTTPNSWVVGENT